MNEFKIVLFAHDYVGKETAKYMFNHHKNDLHSIVLIDGNYELYNFMTELGFSSTKLIWYSEISNDKFLQSFYSNKIDYCILSWWPKIIKSNLIKLPKKGVINFHPSLLPYNRGKDPNFWTLVDDNPFGVTLHLVDNSIDGGDIIFQKKIIKSWEDTGESLYEKAKLEIVSLFKAKYELIKRGDFKPVKQNDDQVTFHYRKELNSRSKIDLLKSYKAKELLNLIRARTFNSHPGCYFIDAGKKYEIQIKIREVRQ